MHLIIYSWSQEFSCWQVKMSIKQAQTYPRSTQSTSWRWCVRGSCNPCGGWSGLDRGSCCLQAPSCLLPYSCHWHDRPQDSEHSEPTDLQYKYRGSKIAEAIHTWTWFDKGDEIKCSSTKELGTDELHREFIVVATHVPKLAFTSIA